MDAFPSLENSFFPNTLLAKIRNQFHYVESDPVTGERIWLESASGSLRLKETVKSLCEQSRYPDQLGRSNESSRRAGSNVTEGMEAVKLFLGNKSGVIAPAMSGTHAVFRIVNAILSSNDRGNVVTTDLEHPCVYDSTKQLCQRYGTEWRVAHLNPLNGFVEPQKIIEKVDRNTLLVAVIHASNITGAILDIAQIVRQVRKRNPSTIILVDGVQFAPHGPIDVDQLGVDAYVFSPYKAFSVKGIGFAYLSDRIAGLNHWKLNGTPRTSWTLGSPEDATYLAWSATVDYLCWIGSHFTDSSDRRTMLTAAMEASQRHIQSLLQLILRGTRKQRGLLQMPHVRLHGIDDSIQDRVCLVLTNLDGLNSSESVAFYDQNQIRVHNRVHDAFSIQTLDALGIKGGVRISACHYNSAEEIIRFLEVTEKAADLSVNDLEMLRQRNSKWEDTPKEG